MSIQLGFDAQNVIALRMLRLATGDARAQNEVRRVVAQKIEAAAEVQGTAISATMTGHKDTVVARGVLKKRVRAKKRLEGNPRLFPGAAHTFGSSCAVVSRLSPPENGQTPPGAALGRRRSSLLPTLAPTISRRDPPTSRTRKRETITRLAIWGITITCRDGSRLRFSDQRGGTPQKGDIFDTADTGQIIKAKIDTYREEKPNGWGHPFFQVTAIEI